MATSTEGAERGAALGALVGALVLFPALVYPYFEDCAMFAAVANYLWNGTTLYSGVFDHKGPAIYMQEMLRIKILGTSALASRIVELSTIILGGSIMGRGVAGLWRKGGAGQTGFLSFSTCVFFCLLCSSSLWGLPERGQAEFYQTAMLALALGLHLLAVENDRPAYALLAGWVGAWATWMKPQFIVLLVLAWVVGLIDVKKGRARKALPIGYAVGVAIPTLLVVGFLFATGAAKPYWFVLTQHYPAHLDATRMPLTQLMRDLPDLFMGGWRGYLGLPLLVAGIIYLIQAYRTERLNGGHLWLLLAPLPAGAFIFVSGAMSLRFHGIPMVLGVSLLLAAGAMAVRETLMKSALPERLRTQALPYALLVACMLPFAATQRMVIDCRDTWAWVAGKDDLFEVHQRRGNEMHYYRYEAQVAAAGVVKRIVPKGESFYILGQGAVTYLLSDRKMTSRFLFPGFSNMPRYRLRNAVHAEIVRDLETKRPPVLLVQDTDAFPWFGLPLTSLGRLQQDKALGPIVQKHYRTFGWIGRTYMVLRRCPGDECAEGK